MARLRLKLLGPVQVKWDSGQPPHFRSQRTMALLGYLAAERRAVARNTLVALFWPDDSDAAGLANLRRELHNLGQILPGCWQLDAHGVHFVPGAETQVDIDDLRCLVEDKKWPDAAAMLDGEFLEGVLLDDNAEFEAWLLGEQERRRQTAEQVLMQAARGEIQRGNAEAALGFLHRLLRFAPWNEEAHRWTMLLLAQDGRFADALRQYEQCRRLLRDELGVEPSAQTRELYEQLARGELPSIAEAQETAFRFAAELDDTPAPGAPPFKGLQSFEEADADLFVGREQLTTRLAGRLLESNGLIVVVGASGSGKSSLVRAGLIPALKASVPLTGGLLPQPDNSQWPICVITPTAKPLEALEACFTGEAGSPRLLLVDQFEELFTLCRDEDERRAFIDRLLALTALEAPALTLVVLVLRADFYASCAPYDGLREAVASQQEYIGPMSAADLRRAIEEPAGLGDWHFEPGLVELILHDVADEPGALPLLSHALLETWQRRRGRTLTFAGYSASGGVRGAITQTAERVYHRLTPEQQATAREIFLQLTELGEEADYPLVPDTRRRVTLDELVSRTGSETVYVLEQLVEARLITTAQDTAEVAHEALIREWPALRQWLTENREGLQVHRRLSRAARAWEEGGRDPGDYYRGGRLEIARKWAAENGGQLSVVERAFLDASQAQADADAAEQVESQKRLAQIEAERKSAARLRRLGVMLAVALALALVLGGLFFSQRQDALAKHEEALAAQGQARNAQATAEAYAGDLERARVLNERLRLVSESSAWLEESPPLALLLAVAAVRDLKGLESDDDAFASLELHLRNVISRTGGLPLTGHEALVTRLEFSPDGRWLATASGTDEIGTIRLWDVNDPERPPVMLEGHDARVVTLAFSPLSRNGTRLATGGNDGSLRLWDWGDLPSPIAGQELAKFESRVSTITFSPYGRWLVAGSEDGVVRLWDLGDVENNASPTQVAEWMAHEQGVSSSAFSPDKLTLATASWDGSAKLWALDDGTFAVPVTQVQNWKGARLIEFSPDGRWLAVANDTGIARLWQAPHLDSELHHELIHSPLLAEVARINALRFSPDNRWLITVGENSVARIWDLNTGELVTELAGHEGPIRDAVLIPDEGGLRVATSSQDRTVRLWNLGETDEPLILRGHEGSVGEVALSPDGQWLATGSGDRTARLWNLNELGRDLENMSLDDLIALPCARAGRDFTEEEWQRYFPAEPPKCTE